MYVFISYEMLQVGQSVAERQQNFDTRLSLFILPPRSQRSPRLVRFDRDEAHDAVVFVSG